MTVITADWLASASAQRALGLLTEAGHAAYFVGGCVRNALIGAEVADLDIATSAEPAEVTALAESAGIRAIPTGFDHGTVTLVIDGQPFEVTTFRRDVETDGRRAVVTFSMDIKTDAERRDFTMNALYLHADGTVIDPLGGLPDLLDRRVRFIGEPRDRIREDYLRILRFFRFHAWYGDPDHGIDAEGLAACAELADGLEGLSSERVGAEIIKLLSAKDPSTSVASMAASGVLMRVLPGAGAHGLPVLVHVEEAMDLAPEPVRRLAVIGGAAAAADLRLSNQITGHLERLDREMHEEKPAAVLGYRLGEETALSVLALRWALIGREPDQETVAVAKHAAAQDFPLSGGDLLPKLEGPALGAALRLAEDAWISSGFTLDRSALLKIAFGG